MPMVTARAKVASEPTTPMVSTATRWARSPRLRGTMATTAAAMAGNRTRVVRNGNAVSRMVASAPGPAEHEGEHAHQSQHDPQRVLAHEPGLHAADPRTHCPAHAGHTLHGTVDDTGVDHRGSHPRQGLPGPAEQRVVDVVEEPRPAQSDRLEGGVLRRRH